MPTVVIGNNTGNDTAGTEDSFITLGSPTVNEGTNAEILVRNNGGGGGERRGLLRFTGLSSYSGATVTSAFIRLNPPSGYFGEIWTITKLTRAWVESEVTWNEYSSGNSWATAGATGTGDSDAASSGTGTLPLTDITFDITLNATGITALQSMIDGSNNGFLIVSDGDGTQRVGSKDGADGVRPELHMTYTAAGGLAIPVVMNQYRQRRA